MTIELPSSEVLADFHQFVARVHRIDADAAIRISVHDTLAVISAAPLFPVGLGDDMPLALALRVLPIVSSQEGNLDAVVPAVALLDRFARAESTDSLAISVPPQRVVKSWTGIAPPRGGWQVAGDTSIEVLANAAEAGIREISAGTPDGAGAHAVSALRRQVWKKPVEVLEQPQLSVPAGVAFALEVCGFLVGPKARVSTAAGWVRVSTPFGHVLTRTAAAPRKNG